jgi:hypothetical protein
MLDGEASASTRAQAAASPDVKAFGRRDMVDDH